MNSNMQKLFDSKKSTFEEHVKRSTLSIKDGSRIIRVPLPPGTKKEELAVGITVTGLIKIRWKPKGVLETIQMIVPIPKSQDHDPDETKASFDPVGVALNVIQPPLKHKIPPATIVQDPVQQNTDANNNEAPKPTQPPLKHSIPPATIVQDPVHQNPDTSNRDAQKTTQPPVKNNIRPATIVQDPVYQNHDVPKTTQPPVKHNMPPTAIAQDLVQQNPKTSNHEAPKTTQPPVKHNIPQTTIAQDLVQQNPDTSNREAPKTTQSTDTSDQNDEIATRRVEEERDGGGGRLEDGRTKSKSMGYKQDGESNTRMAAAATMTEVAAAGHSAAAAAAAYLEGAKKLIWTHRREMLNVAVGLAILGISIYVITGRRHD
ncbi:unnamed protein product [Cuscuta epithymum]|uniref:Uncharacterized protein n=1 Tax=Cuscuta epithymum TaxID=186058 RepID=A0AAV0DR64_9ASTE|nr:unnamed protein product [Cuscuta epithymum]